MTSALSKEFLGRPSWFFHVFSACLMMGHWSQTELPSVQAGTNMRRIADDCNAKVGNSDEVE